jgi:hypothetical protein
MRLCLPKWRGGVGRLLGVAVVLCVVWSACAVAQAGQQDVGTVVQRAESFDADPGWDGHNNRVEQPPYEVRQDFGFSPTAHVGGAPGEIGGFVTPAAEPAYYAKPIPTMTLNDTLTASGRLVVAPSRGRDESAGNTLIGFFNSDTINEWRTPNTIAFRINGRGEEGFHVHVEYATCKWRAGAEFFGELDPAVGRKVARLFPSGDAVHSWSLHYDPTGNGGGGAITATFDGEPLVVHLSPGHKADGATFNRFGLLNVLKSADDGGTLWLDDVTINGAEERFDEDPGLEGFRNRCTYTTTNVRPWFDFGFSQTRYAGGEAAGEVGGLIFRGDERFPERMAYYGDRLRPLTLDKPLRASGKVALRRGVTDSTVLFGFFHSRESMRVSAAQVSGLPESFVGIAIEGPSREGFYFYPAYGLTHEAHSGGLPMTAEPPHILPDGRPPCVDAGVLPGGRKRQRRAHRHPRRPGRRPGASARGEGLGLPLQPLRHHHDAH